ncbi:MAG TPA: histidine phosphatase family protein [Candidatus Paceibacterota bacterium]
MSKQETIKTPETDEAPRFLKLFVVRHGETNYLERETVKREGKWDPDIWDITPKGERVLLDTASRIAQEIDPDKNIVVFLSSPRARTLSSAKVLEKYFQEHGIEVLETESPVIEMLRSGSDTSPVVGLDNKVEHGYYAPKPDYSIENEGEEQPQGGRFKKFLSYFASIDKEALLKKISEEGSGGKFRGKIPVFVAITHGEITHAGMSPQRVYEGSFLGQTFSEYERLKLQRGRAMKLEFDLDKVGDFSLTIPPETSPKKMAETKRLHFDSKDGAILSRPKEETHD